MRLDPVKISSKTEAVNPSHLHNVLRMLYNRVNRTIGSLAIRNVGQKCRAKIKTCHTAFFRQQADHIIRQIPHPAADGTGIGVAGDKRFFWNTQHIHKAGIGQVGHINDHAQPLHFLNKSNPGLRQPLRSIGFSEIRAEAFSVYSLSRLFQIGPAQFIGIVPGKGKHTDAQTV